MPFFYLCHHLFHYTFDMKNKSDGQKNCMILLFGTIAWVLLWVLLFTFKNHFYYEALRTGFIVVLLADIVTMAYLYKAYYGRFIFHELGEEPSSSEWKYNKKINKYKRKDVYDKRVDDYEKRKAFNKYLDNLEEENKKIHLDKITAAIIKNKNSVRAANYIQDWWRIHTQLPSKSSSHKKFTTNPDKEE